MEKTRIISALILLAATSQAGAKEDSTCSLMQRLAQEHSNDMARRDNIDHDGFYSRAARGAAAENVAMGRRTKAETMAQWRASPGHAANMQLPGCKAVAYAISSSGRYYWTMEIAKPPSKSRVVRSAGEFASGSGTTDSVAASVQGAAQKVWSGISDGIGKLRRVLSP